MLLQDCLQLFVKRLSPVMLRLISFEDISRPNCDCKKTTIHYPHR